MRQRSALARASAWIALLAVLPLLTGACRPSDGAQDTQVTPAVAPAQRDEALLVLPVLKAVDLEGRKLRVLATTSIVGDVISQVGGNAIELTTLMGPGQDPHSYQPAAADLTAAARADVIFINGWNLEEGLLDDLANIGEGMPLVPVNAGITPLMVGGEGHETGTEDDAAGADPHTWLNVGNVMRWVDNAAAELSALDPANAPLYTANARAYRAQLDELDTDVRNQLATIPAEKRVIVTNHNAFAYFAEAYGFDIQGTIIPGASTLSEPTASDLAALIQGMEDKGVCTIFTETTVSDQLGQTVAAELTGCDHVQVIKLFTGALGPAGSGADTYVDMMRADVNAIVSGLSKTIE